MTDATKRLHKSRSDRMIDGVCAGIAEYFGVDPTLVRVAFVLLLFAGGAGLLLYLVGMIIMPSDLGSPVETTAKASPKANSRFWGVLLVVIGIVWLLGNLGFRWWHLWWGFGWHLFLPLVMILAGVAFLFGGRAYITEKAPAPAGPESSQQPPAAPAGPSRLYRSRSERKILGVCGGLGVYFNIDPTIVRLLFILAAFMSFGFVILLYLAMAFIVPDERVTAGAS